MQSWSSNFRGGWNAAEQPWSSNSKGGWNAAEQLAKNANRMDAFNAEKAKWNAENAAKEMSEVTLPAIDWSTQPRQPFCREFIPYGYVDLMEAESLRNSIGITVEQDPSGVHTTPKPIQHFHEIPILPHWVMKALADNKWYSPTAIQSQALPIAIAGRDMIGIAQTGSGKTAAFLLPALIHIEAQVPLARSDPGPVALVLAPTRELAVQIKDEAQKMTKHSWESTRHRTGLRATVFYGGGNKREQLNEFTAEGSHIAVATPGRLIDCLSEGTVSLRRVTYLVLDEADRMLDMGFAGDSRSIASHVRPERQTMFFSATWSAEVQKLARDFCSQDPVRIRAGQAAKHGASVSAQENASSTFSENDEVLSAREGITQQVVIFDGPDWEKRQEEKRRYLDMHVKQTLSCNGHNKVLVFVNEKKFADELVWKLCQDGFQAQAIHGGRKQAERLWALEEFKKGKLRLLIATDVLGRGIDIPSVSHVVIYEMGDIEGYIHRIGRTARGKDAKGHALVLFEYYWKYPQNAQKLADVLQRCKQDVPPELLGIAQDVVGGKRDICDEYGKRIPVGETCAAWAKKRRQW